MPSIVTRRYPALGEEALTSRTYQLPKMLPSPDDFGTQYFSHVPFLIPGSLTLDLTFLAIALLAFFTWRRLRSVETLPGLNQIRDAIATLRSKVAERVEIERSLVAAIQDERRASTILREREQQIQLSFKAGRVGTWTWQTRSGEVTCDAQMRELFGFPLEDSILNVDQFLARIYPGDVDTVRNALVNALMSGPEYNVEYRVIHPDGSARWVSSLGAVIRDRSGEPTAMTGINLDIHTRRIAELALGESEQQFRTLADSIPQLAWMADPEGNRFWHNRRWYEYTGISPEEMTGMGWQSFHHPLELTEIKAQWEACTSTGQPLSLEYRLKGADGKYRWFLKRATPLSDSLGRITRWFGTETDITEMKEARDALRESENQFRQIADSMPQLVWVTRPDGHVEWWNQRWYSYTGTTLEQTGGDGWATRFHEDDLPASWETWRDSLRTGKPVEVQNRVRRHDGVYRWFLGRGIPIRDSLGNIVKWFGTCTDIEDYKRAEAEIQSLNESLEQRVFDRTSELAAANEVLAETQSRLQAVLDSVTRVSVIGTDLTGVITIFNNGAERMLQYRADEVIGIHTPEIIHVPAEMLKQSEILSQKLNRPVQGFDVFREPAQLGVFDEGEWTYTRKDGSTLQVCLAVSTVRDEDGLPIGFLGIATDITAQKLLEQELRENNSKLTTQTERAEKANLAKSAFVAAMSHEIRTPMNAILGMSDLLWESQLDPDQRQYVEIFRRAGNVLLDLINSVLDLSKIESGHLELESSLFDLEDVVTRTVELLGPKAVAKGIELLYRIAPDVQTKRIGDAVRLQQILVNLVGNAVKFTELGEVLLRVQTDSSGDSGRLEISISDTGIGISPEHLGTIFNDFNQADVSTTRRYGGTGLGLGIAHRLIAAMGGELEVKSHIGVGSVFRFSVALRPGVERRLAPRNEINDLHGLSILVIDNNETNRLILRETLTSWGLISVECAGVEAGCREILRARDGNRPYAMVLLDRHMPHTDGFAAIPLLRDAAPGIPIVMLTSDTLPGDAARRALSGLSGYAVRPVKRADLLRLICSALGTQPRPGSGPAFENSLVARPTAALRSLRVLIAEDSPDNTILLKAYLKNDAYALTFAENGRQAIEQYQNGDFDLILMDVQMPVMDGLEGSRAIRRFEVANGRPPVPIIALTANALAHDAAASYQAGCNGHLSKPISKQKLLQAIEQYGHLRGDASSCSPIWIESPEGLEEFVPEYLASRQKELPVLVQLLTSSEFDEICRKAHDLKGAGNSFGFLEITRIGTEMELSAKSRNADEISRQLDALGDYLNRVKILSASTR